MNRLTGMAGACVAAVFLSGCSYVPPAPAAIPADELVAASYDATWSAVVDWFASQQIRVETIEKASGFIVARTQWTDTFNGIAAADCGRQGRTGYAPNLVHFNVRVKPVGEQATIRVNAEYSRLDSRPCHSTGAWERRLISRVQREVAGIR